MRCVNLLDLLSATEINDLDGNLTGTVSFVTSDSRQVREGALFVAVKGYKSDGHKYIQSAIEKGAIAAVIEDRDYISDNYPWILVPDTRKALADFSAAFCGYPSSKLNLIGVTGTNGKTTTTNLITAILDDYGHKAGLIGTIHCRIGKDILPAQHTTPEAPELQQLFCDFLGKGADYAVMEVSSHALELQRVRGCDFDVAVFTNLTQDHLDFHGNMEKYLMAKSRLFYNLGRSSRKKRRKYAIINIDDPAGQQLASMTTASIITYGVNNNADVRAEQVEVAATGVRYQLRYTNQVIPVSLQLTGMFNVYNSLAAIAVGLVENIPVSSIIASLEKIAGIPGRFEKVNAGQDFTVIVDYSHTPDGLDNCLRTARAIARGRLITVFGCGGDRDRSKRPLMGEIAGRLSDFVVVTSDNPRSECPQDIINDIVAGLSKVMDSQQFLKVEDRQAAIRLAIQEARAGDVVVIAGKGHESYQIIGERVLSFDDREAAAEAIRTFAGRSL